MRNWLIVMILLLGMQTYAQTSFDKKELKMVAKKVKNPKLRRPVPLLMTDDHVCHDQIMLLSKMDDSQLQLLTDSVKARQEENAYLKERVASAVKSQDAAMEFIVKADREEQRYLYFMSEIDRVKADKAAFNRPAPKGNLVSLEFDHSGMRYYPQYPTIITYEKGDSASVVFGRMKTPVSIPCDVVKKLQDIIAQNELYRLLRSYDFLIVPLPDFPQERMLDGMRWLLNIKYSDGFEMSSSGDYIPLEALHELEKVLNDVWTQYGRPMEMP